MTQCVNRNETRVSLLKRDTRDMVDCLEYIALFCIVTHFKVLWGCFKAITQPLDSDWPANVLAGLNSWAQEK